MTAALPLLQLFQPLLSQSTSSMVSCAEREASCLQPGVPARQTPVKGTEHSPAQGNAGLSQLHFRECMWEVLPCIWALGVGNVVDQRPLARLWCCLSSGWCLQHPHAPGTSSGAGLKAAAACRRPVSLVTAGRRYFGKEAGSAGKDRPVSREGC